MTTTSSPAPAQIQADSNPLDDAWNDWLSKHGRIGSSDSKYFSQPFPIDKAVFSQQYDIIEQHNLRYEQGLETYKMKVDRTATMPADLFASTFLTTTTLLDMIPLPELITINGKPFMIVGSSNIYDDLPESWNITADGPGKLSSIKDQGSCGACWAISTLGAIENLYSKQTGDIVELSEQEQLDCNPAGYGCKGGWFTAALNYVKANGSLPNSAYPYDGSVGKCKDKADNDAALTNLISGYTNLADDPDQIKWYLKNKGACAVGVDASKWQFYGDGVFTMPEGTNATLDHGVVLTGYGKDYWLIKNSWGEDFGLNGYIKVSNGGRGGIFTNFVFCPTQ